MNNNRLRKQWKDESGCSLDDSSMDSSVTLYIKWLEDKILFDQPKAQDWLKFNENKELFAQSAKNNCLCKFDNGDILNYNDNFPFAELTHFKSKEKEQTEKGECSTCGGSGEYYLDNVNYVCYGCHAAHKSQTPQPNETSEKSIDYKLDKILNGIKLLMQHNSL